MKNSQILLLLFITIHSIAQATSTEIGVIKPKPLRQTDGNQYQTELHKFIQSIQDWNTKKELDSIYHMKTELKNLENPTKNAPSNNFNRSSPAAHTLNARHASTQLRNKHRANSCSIN